MEQVADQSDIVRSGQMKIQRVASDFDQRGICVRFPVSMRTRLIVASLAAVLVMALPSDSARPLQRDRIAAARESRIPAGKASLYSREIGRGLPIIVLHGGPDFAQSLTRLGLVDEYQLSTVPIAIGAGHSPFAKLDQHLKLDVVEEQRFRSGALAQTLVPRR